MQHPFFRKMLASVIYFARPSCFYIQWVAWNKAFCLFPHRFQPVLLRHPFGVEAAGREQAVVNTACDYFN